jgi:hypothetical protein
MCKMLPTAIENIISHYAYGVGRYNLHDELDFIAANRGLIPTLFLRHLVCKTGYWGCCEPLECYLVKNPLREDNPFFPWALIDKRAFLFGNTFIWWANSVRGTALRRLKTYGATFRKYVFLLVNGGRDIGTVWNVFMNRYINYIQEPILTDFKSYSCANHEKVFLEICKQLKSSGYFSPMISLGPRPSQRSVLSPTYEPLV